MIRLRDRAWSPYLTGALIGLLQVPAVLLLGLVIWFQRRRGGTLAGNPKAA